MNERQAAAEIEKAYRKIDQGDQAPVSLWKIWYSMEHLDMTQDELYAGAVFLARNRDDVVLTPVLYPWEYSENELNCGPRFGGQHCQTIIIQ